MRKFTYQKIYTQHFKSDFEIRAMASRGWIHREEGYKIKIKILFGYF